MAVTALSTVQEYDEFIKFKDLSIIHFYAPWAEQCKQINDILDEMTSLSEFTKVKFAKIEAENLPEVSLKAGIVAVPTILLYKNGEIIDRIDGVNPALLTEKVKKHLISEDSTPIDVAVPKDALEARLKKLINQAPSDYQTFDILQDNAVREGLKKFSNWPTYPQLYLNGELIGGLDIVKEMSESGELESMLPKKNASQERS
ncbi:hypothetical protein KPH14_005884 [Odynerus spinipes]|uniref:Thioredoxin domain-containing protein n=1 Tax=Odynerus spinipes TaxID=1348599 RepID=A0AAD9RDL4_9HYME|nr:hypothetical protein KPH14_005884 [Odynerus spinipes]